MRSIFVAAPLLMATITSHAAEVEKIRTESGKPVQIGYYLVLRADCSVGKVPEIRLTALPKSGSILVQDGTLTTTQLPNCPKISAPVRQILYQPGNSFMGEDEVRFDVIDPVDGTTVSHSVTITVGAPATRI